MRATVAATGHPEHTRHDRALDPPSSVRELSLGSVPLAPNKVVFHSEAGVGGAIAMHQCLAKLEDERVLGVDGKIHFAPNDEIPLRVILVSAVDRGVAAKGIARIESGPQPVVEGIADVSFKSG